MAGHVEASSPQVSPPQELWGSELAASFPTADYGRIMAEDGALLEWLETLDRVGFVLVRGVPVERGPVPALQVGATHLLLPRLGSPLSG